MDSASNPADERASEMESVNRLVQKARGGDEDAFGELVKMYYQRVYGLAYGMIGHVEDAREVTQQVWVKVWNKIAGFKAESGFFTWVYRIASNASLDFIRHRARRREDLLPDGVTVESFGDLQPERAASTVTRPDRELAREETREQFEAALRGLSEEHRLAITLREVDGLSYEEIAKVMGCRKGTVMSRIFYARRRLQEELRGVR